MQWVSSNLNAFVNHVLAAAATSSEPSVFVEKGRTRTRAAGSLTLLEVIHYHPFRRFQPSIDPSSA
jgi:hypothetical protein